MSEKIEDSSSFPDLMLKSPLFSCIIREHLWLKKFTVSKPFLKKAVEDPRFFKDFSVLKSIRTEDSTSTSVESLTKPTSSKSQEKKGPQLKLYKDFQWSTVPEYYWPIYSGDCSPLSPDGEFLERHGKIGVDFWNWHRETSPLGYIPPLCTCKRTEDCVKYLRKLSKNQKVDYEYTVCDNDVCRGLLYVPYSLLEIPLNRVISNGSEFAVKVKVPDYTDVYCGNMKHTIILCTTSKKHEEECLEAIELSEVSSPLIYDVDSRDFVPFFKKYNDTKLDSPLMSLEPIDSDVSDTENYGLGQLFAIKKLGNNLLIEKYDPNTKTTTAIDDPLMETWEKMCKLDSPDSDLKLEVKENTTSSNKNKESKSKEDNNNNSNNNKNENKKDNGLKRQNSNSSKDEVLVKVKKEQKEKELELDRNNSVDKDNGNNTKEDNNNYSNNNKNENKNKQDNKKEDKEEKGKEEEKPVKKRGRPPKVKNENKENNKRNKNSKNKGDKDDTDDRDSKDTDSDDSRGMKMKKENRKGSKNDLKKEMKKESLETKKEGNKLENKLESKMSEEERMKKELESQEFQIYELIESFSSDRRPLSFSLRDEFRLEKVGKRSNSNGSNNNKEDNNNENNKEDKGVSSFNENSKRRKVIKVDQKTLESTHMLNILSKF